MKAISVFGKFCLQLAFAVLKNEHLKIVEEEQLEEAQK